MHFTFDLVVFWCYTFMYVFAIGGSFYVFFLYFQFARNFLIILNSNRFYFFMYIAAFSGGIPWRQIKIRQTQKRHKPDCLTVKIVIYAHCFTRFWVTFAQGSNSILSDSQIFWANFDTPFLCRFGFDEIWIKVTQKRPLNPWPAIFTHY